MSARTDVADQLRLATSLPKKDYDVKDVADLPDSIRKTTIFIESDGLEQAPNANGTIYAKYKITVATPLTDIDKAEDALDQDLPNLLQAIQGIKNMTWTTADPSTIKTLYRGYTVRCSVPINRPF